MKLTLALSVLLAFSVLAAQPANASTCPDRGGSTQVEEAWERAKEDACADLKDPEEAMAMNPFVYKDPNAMLANCGLGLELPGLPSFGIDFDYNFDVCDAVESLSGDLVRDINSKMQDWMSDATDKVTDVNGIKEN
ncbi:hypothetical protein [Ferrimonas marina]|uniref:Uncharacterized protein n=1 Tax=Ferrimonas marina TaxID=299255 RepID=A0A1M5TI01_9GAMM|nr:hypothetical protein [Ferrimonas marina]SHH50291.1 hypothetical protein SAMN02745129_2150 [Ferrimonas marina]